VDLVQEFTINDLPVESRDYDLDCSTEIKFGEKGEKKISLTKVVLKLFTNLQKIVDISRDVRKKN